MTLVAAYGFSEGSGTTAADSSGNNHTLTLSTASWTASGHTGAGLTNTVASSVGASATVPSFTSAVTLMCWVKPLDLASGTGHFICGLIQSSGNTDVGLFTQRAGFSTANVLQADVRVGGGLVAANGSAMTLNTWAHVAVTFDGANIKLYKDGALVTTVANTGAISTTTTLYVAGANASAGLDTDVVVDDVRLFDTALDQATIATMKDTPVGVSASSGAKIWTGSAWADSGALKIYSGTAWTSAAAPHTY